MNEITKDLLEALRECVDAAWLPDSHAVRFDGTVVFSEFYDFRQLNSASREEFLAQYDCVIWPGHKWSAYCTYEGSMWFEQFDSAEEAKEQCMRLLDTVLPEHPFMKARAAIAKAEAAFASPQPADDGWIPWAGGDCPVTVGTRVDAKFRDGEKAYNVPAGDCGEDPDSRRASDWSHMESNYDIIAYRIAKGADK